MSKAGWEDWEAVWLRVGTNGSIPSAKSPLSLNFNRPKEIRGSIWWYLHTHPMTTSDKITHIMDVLFFIGLVILVMVFAKADREHEQKILTLEGTVSQLQGQVAALERQVSPQGDKNARPEGASPSASAPTPATTPAPTKAP